MRGQTCSYTQQPPRTEHLLGEDDVGVKASHEEPGRSSATSDTPHLPFTEHNDIFFAQDSYRDVRFR